MKKYYSKILFALPMLVALFTFTSISNLSNEKFPPRIKLESVDVRRLDWDQINIDYVLINEEEGTSLQPDQTVIKVYNAKGKLVSQTFGKRVLLNDASLGSEEQLKIEIEVTAAGNKYTHATSVKTSKKLLNFKQEIVYPIRKQLYAGACSIKPQFLRQKFGSTNEYELLNVDARSVQYFLQIAQAGAQKKIAIPVKAGTSKFKLNKASQFEEFIPILESAMAENNVAKVKFSVIGLWNDKRYEGETTEVELAFSGVIQRTIRPSLQIERIAVTENKSDNTIALGSLAEIQRYAKVISKKLPETYSVVPDALQVQVHQWKFDASTNFYEASISIQWNNSLVQEEKYLVKGTLVVDKQGQHPDFQRSYANQTIIDIEKYSSPVRAMASVR